MTILYEDDKIVCDEDGVTIRGYYFPFGTEKRIEYRRIERVEVHPIGTFTGRYRIWGTSDPRYWLNLDWHRPDKDRCIVLHVGGWIKPVITPGDPDAVLGVLEDKAGVRPA
jgi:hypothetical protein